MYYKEYILSTKMSEVEILNTFKKDLVTFFDELIEQFPNDGKLLLLRIFFADQAVISVIIKKFILNINKEIVEENKKKPEDSKRTTVREMIKKKMKNYLLIIIFSV